jgi:hypothetical protein
VKRVSTEPAFGAYAFCSWTGYALCQTLFFFRASTLTPGSILVETLTGIVLLALGLSLIFSSWRRTGIIIIIFVILFVISPQLSEMTNVGLPSNTNNVNTTAMSISHTSTPSSTAATSTATATTITASTTATNTISTSLTGVQITAIHLIASDFASTNNNTSFTCAEFFTGTHSYVGLTNYGSQNLTVSSVSVQITKGSAEYYMVFHPSASCPLPGRQSTTVLFPADSRFLDVTTGESFGVIVNLSDGSTVESTGTFS